MLFSICVCFTAHLSMNIIVILSKKKFTVSFAMLLFLTRGIFSDCKVGTSCFVEFCGPCTRFVHFEYTVSDLNYTDITSITKKQATENL